MRDSDFSLDSFGPVPFTKMHGLGNDFIVIDDLARSPHDGTSATHARRPGAPALTPQFAIEICDRRFGVGADQILWLREPHDQTHHARMEILNSDGSVAEMCGNGIRAVALYLEDHGPRSDAGASTPGPSRIDYRIETLAGTKVLKISGEGQARTVDVDMGPPALGANAREGERLEVGGQNYIFHEVSMGNPHAIIFVKDVAKIALAEVGPLIERHPRFAHKTNVEFVQVLGPSAIQVRVWERGAGITLACGTGACAAAVASLLTQQVSGRVRVALPGGDLHIRWAGDSSPVFMDGPATEVFAGTYRG